MILLNNFFLMWLQFYTEKLVIHFTPIKWRKKLLLFVYEKALLNQSFIRFQTTDFIDSSFNHILTKNNAEAASKWDVLTRGWPSWHAVLML